MRDRCLGILLALSLFGAVPLCLADEFSGKLERVDWETVTILGSDNQRLTVRVDQDNRKQAAPFLGKWVSVDFQPDQGQPRAIRFKACR
ncbi:MAG: hypothetical protein HY912_06070 [Desulfomonile tiedjei]|uniref:DUF5666 domain-containing protein n=1 Tax=Desulfomonile tiedjei TaxID=2358 RepID=A0A9D6YZP0_9BACT|nr:hypothetical protein [Desulfomonile tiedjei]